MSEIVGVVCTICLRFYPKERNEDGSMNLDGIDGDLDYSVMFEVGCAECSTSTPGDQG